MIACVRCGKTPKPQIRAVLAVVLRGVCPRCGGPLATLREDS